MLEDLRGLLVALAVACGVLAAVITYGMQIELEKHGRRIPYFRGGMRWLVTLGMYLKMTTEREGQAGMLFVYFLLALGAGLAFLILTIFLS